MLMMITAAEIANVITAAAMGCFYIHGAIVISVAERYAILNCTDSILKLTLGFL